MYTLANLTNLSQVAKLKSAYIFILWGIPIRGELNQPRIKILRMLRLKRGQLRN